MLLVALSGLAVVLGAGRRVPGASGPSSPAGEPHAALRMPSPLPSGAPPYADEPPLDEASSGCHFPDHGFGVYGDWRALPVGRALVPAEGGVGDDGGFDLLVHFHGAEPVRKQLALEDTGLVVAAIDAGTLSSHYAQVLPSPDAWARLVASVELEVARATGRPSARASAIIVSSWSAGYGAVTEVLRRPDDRIQGWVLLDSLHASYAPGSRVPLAPQLAPFVELARRAADEGPLFYLTHTAIRPEAYASTTEVATFLIQEATGEAAPFPASAPAGEETRAARKGRFVVRGYAGDGKEAHCEQLRLLPPILRDHLSGRVP